MAAVVPFNTRTILGRNQETYQQLRLTLGLNLRRQLLLAVCDDADLQHQLANRLAQDLTPDAQLAGRGEAVSPAVVTIWLSPREPDLIKQIVGWLQQHGRRSAPAGLPTFQVLGIDQLIRQSATRQNQFLSSLTRLEPLLARLDIRLLLWIPRPWLNQIRRSVPAVWHLRSGVFDFAGEPNALDPEADLAPASPEEIGESASTMPASSSDPPGPGPSRPSSSPPETSAGQPQPRRDSMAPPMREMPPASRPAAPLPAVPPDPSPVAHDVWTMLTEDLSSLETPEAQPEPLAVGPDSGETPLGRDFGMLTGSGPGGDGQAGAPEPWQPQEITPLALGALAGEADALPDEARPVPPPATPAMPAIPEVVTTDPRLLECWQHLQTLTQRQAGPLTLGRASLALGQTCRQLIEAGDCRLDLLSLAIAAYTQAIPGLRSGTVEWCDALNDLGSVYWLYAQGDPAAADHWLQASIQTYEQALQPGPENLEPDTLARIYSNLGTVYGLLAVLQDPVKNLEQAVRAYRRALNYRPAQVVPTEYASLNNSLGAIHWRLAQQDDNRHHLNQAIAAYREALQYRLPQDSPQDYAMLQNNLGIAYWSLAKHERPSFLLEQSIEAYQAALAFRTIASDPAGCAATHNNLGTAFWDLAQQPTTPPQQQIALWQQAIAAYESALIAANRALEQAPDTALNFDLWATFHSAGVVHDQLAQHASTDRHGDGAAHLQQALQHYLMALHGWQSQPDKLDLLKAALRQNIRLHYQLLGLEAQQQVLEQIPAQLLPDILPRL